MKPWFVVFTLWAFAGMVALRTVYSNDESVLDQNVAPVAVDQ
ncbi:MAG TPA: hypothetical protein VKP30_10810 [Polyangiaceae bacterium]|nr:hypothetical protein [Polyangiaceae bacterium]